MKIRELSNAMKRNNTRIIGIPEEEEPEKKRDKKIQEYEGKIRELSDALKKNNLCIIGIPEEEERGKGAEGVLKK